MDNQTVGRSHSQWKITPFDVALGAHIRFHLRNRGEIVIGATLNMYIKVISLFTLDRRRISHRAVVYRRYGFTVNI